MQTFDQALFDLYEAGQVTYEDALRNADSVNDLRLQIKLKSQIFRMGMVFSGGKRNKNRLKTFVLQGF
jgi:twitching motility protein PilU